MTYLAFLRGINVAGQKLIKMHELARMFKQAGFRDARTFIASGNVIFESSSARAEALEKKIERVLEKELGYEVPVIVRSLTELERIVARQPFKKFDGLSAVGRFVVFFKGQPQSKLKLPFFSETENLEVFEIKDGAAFILSRRRKNGTSGSPNAVVENQLGVPATTRNWNTITKIVALTKSSDQAVSERKK